MWQQGLLAVLTSVLFAGSFVAGKYATSELGPLTITLFRYVIALVFLQGLVWLEQNRKGREAKGEGKPPFATLDSLNTSTGNWVRLQPQHRLPMFLLGTFGVVGYHYFFFLSLRYTVVANTAIINAFNPVVTGFLAAIFLKERLSQRNYLGGCIAILGVLILLTQGNLLRLLQLQFNLGDVLMLCAVICWAIYSNLLRFLGRTYSGLAMSYYGALFGVIQLLFWASLELWNQPWHWPSLPTMLGILYMGIGASGIGYLLFVLSTQRIGPTKSTSIVYSGVPVWVTLLAWIFFREAVTAWMLLSIILILLGLWTVLQPAEKHVEDG